MGARLFAECELTGTQTLRGVILALAERAVAAGDGDDLRAWVADYPGLSKEERANLCRFLWLVEADLRGGAAGAVDGAAGEPEERPETVVEASSSAAEPETPAAAADELKAHGRAGRKPSLDDDDRAVLRRALEVAPYTPTETLVALMATRGKVVSTTTVLNHLRAMGLQRSRGVGGTVLFKRRMAERRAAAGV